MPKVTFVEFDGVVHEVDAPEGSSLMQAAVDNAVPGIDADCGGNCMCACHVILDEQWYAKLGGPNPEEKEMLSLAPERFPTSRLSCQIRVDESLDGLRVNLPQFQM